MGGRGNFFLRVEKGGGDRLSRWKMGGGGCGCVGVDAWV